MTVNPDSVPCEQPEHREIEPFQRIADGRGNDDAAAHLRHQFGLHIDPFRFGRPTLDDLRRSVCRGIVTQN